jgi:4-amino-4-deoxy-L-arabinose transferase-like glycosyltransferase
VSRLQHAARIGLLMAGSAILLFWISRHLETSFADGLRYIHQAERIDSGSWKDGLLRGVDHPLHPLAIVTAHHILGGSGPASWQQAAILVAFASAILLVLPIYLLTLELYGDRAAWLGCMLVMLNPLIGYIVVNVLSECTFLLFWTFGLWSAVRFLREGKFAWLPAAIGFGVLAYLARPEGMLLPVALCVTLFLLPLLRVTQINWPRWWAALAFLAVGLVLLSGPYVVFKGGIGTKPGIARVLGLAPKADPMGLERERPLSADQSTLETYRIAAGRMAKVFRSSVTPPLFPLALMGILVGVAPRSRLRAWILLSLILIASALALVRLHATGGYCTVRHGLVPGIILTIAAAGGLSWLIAKVSIPGRWLRLGQERVKPGPAIWAVLIGVIVVLPNLQPLGPPVPGPFSVYYSTADWIAENTAPEDQVLDLTDWSLFFSKRAGYVFANVYTAPEDSRTRWIVVRKPHVEGRWHYSKVLQGLIGKREPVALIPAVAAPSQVQIRIYDRFSPPSTPNLAVGTTTANPNAAAALTR